MDVICAAMVIFPIFFSGLILNKCCSRNCDLAKKIEIIYYEGRLHWKRLTDCLERNAVGIM